MTQFNIIDGIIIVVLLGGAWQGFRHGLIRSLIKMLAMLLTLVGGVFFSGTIADYLEQLFGLRTLLSGMAGQAISNLLGTSALAEGSAATAGDVIEQLKNLQLPFTVEQFLEGQLQNLSESAPGLIDSTAGFLGNILGNLLLNALSFLLILLAVNLVTSIIYWLLRDVLHIARSPLDSLAGICFGLIKSALFAAIILALLCAPLAWQRSNSISVMMQQSMLANALLDFFYYIVGGSIDIFKGI